MGSVNRGVPLGVATLPIVETFWGVIGAITSGNVAGVPTLVLPGFAFARTVSGESRTLTLVEVEVAIAVTGTVEVWAYDGAAWTKLGTVAIASPGVGGASRGSLSGSFSLAEHTQLYVRQTVALGLFAAAGGGFVNYTWA